MKRVDRPEDCWYRLPVFQPWNCSRWRKINLSITTVSERRGISSTGCWERQIRVSNRLMTSLPSVDLSTTNWSSFSAFLLCVTTACNSLVSLCDEKRCVSYCRLLSVVQSRGNAGNAVTPNSFFGGNAVPPNNIRTRGNGDTVAFHQIGLQRNETSM